MLTTAVKGGCNKLGRLRKVNPGNRAVLSFSVCSTMEIKFGGVMFIVDERFRRRFGGLMSNGCRRIMRIRCICRSIRAVPRRGHGPGHGTLCNSMETILVKRRLVSSPFNIVGTIGFCRERDFRLLCGGLIVLKRTSCRDFGVYCELEGMLTRDKKIAHNVYRISRGKCLLSIASHMKMRQVDKGPVCPGRLRG